MGIRSYWLWEHFGEACKLKEPSLNHFLRAFFRKSGWKMLDTTGDKNYHENHRPAQLISWSWPTEQPACSNVAASLSPLVKKKLLVVLFLFMTNMSFEKIKPKTWKLPKQTKNGTKQVQKPTKHVQKRSQNIQQASRIQRKNLQLSAL